MCSPEPWTGRAVDESVQDLLSCLATRKLDIENLVQHLSCLGLSLFHRFCTAYRHDRNFAERSVKSPAQAWFSLPSAKATSSLALAQCEVRTDTRICARLLSQHCETTAAPIG